MRVLVCLIGLAVTFSASAAKKPKERTALSRPKVLRSVAPQVKQELTAYWSECNLHGGQPCMILGAAYEKGEVLEKNHRFAADLYAKTCDEGKNAGACYKAGMRHYKGLEGEDSKPAALGFFKKSCDMGQLNACTNLGTMLIKGEGGEAQPKAAMTLFQDACERTHAQACVEWAIALEQGSAGSPDLDRALRVYGTGCDQGALDGCYRGAALAISGKIGKQDFVAALGWFERGCDGDHAGSCLALGMMYEKGMGVRMDIEEARVLYDKTCKLGSRKACLKKQKLP